MSIRETLISESEAADIRRRYDAFEAWCAGRSSYRLEEVPADVPHVSNEERGKLEQFEIWRDAPKRLFAYVKATEDEKNPPLASMGLGCVVTTWTGDPLGYGGWAPPYRSNFGDIRRSVTVTIAGHTYSGTAYVSAGDYCRLRRLKG